ncbi:MAG: DegT/DnrJ/EryC1/StrS family aminotransferase [Phycisphaerales bacterium]|nr:DegT/DnrJ/EryC1/StrS family aminotransferase [Phycisphaerales bacterium]
MGQAGTTTAQSARGLSTLAVLGGSKTAEPNVGMIAVKLTDADVDAAVGVLRSGMLAAGKHATAFEERFAKMTGAKHAISCANGTCALQLAYGALIEPGDEVLCPGWTFIATASMLAAAGAKIVWVDVDPKTFCIDVEDARRKATDKTVAIACTHLYGNPVNIDGVERLAADRGLSIIYDAAQAHLASYRGKGLGAYGDVVTYSFYPTKNMTCGEGGMVTTNDDELANKMRLLRSHGEISKYTHGMIGFNYRLSDVEAAIGNSQLDRIEAVTERRRANAATIADALATIDGLHAPVATDGAAHVFHLYPIRVEPEKFISPKEAGIEADNVRDMLCKALNAEGIGTAVHYPKPLTRQPVFDGPGVQHQAVCDRLTETLFCVPVHNFLSEQQVAQVCDALKKVAGALKRS